MVYYVRTSVVDEPNISISSQQVGLIVTTIGHFLRKSFAVNTYNIQITQDGWTALAYFL